MISDGEAYEIYASCVHLWGSTSQFLMVIEELNELAVTLCHGLRGNKPFELEDIKGEMADVQVMLEQLQYMLKFTDQELQEERQKKLQRLKELIKFEQENR